MLEHFIYSSSGKPATSSLCSPYYRYSSESSSSFCILSFLVRATSIDQTFYPAMHYLAAVWLDSRHGPNIMSRWDLSSFNILMTSFGWSWAHWRSCSPVLMFHGVSASWGPAGASAGIRETRLLAVLLSRRAVRGPTGSESRAIVRKVRIGLIVVGLVNLGKFG